MKLQVDKSTITLVPQDSEEAAVAGMIANQLAMNVLCENYSVCSPGYDGVIEILLDNELQVFDG